MTFGTHDFTLRQLQYVVAVADTLSFRRAAELCRVSQPSLSAQVAQVEDVLGLRLFERDKRRVIVSPAGQDVLLQARRLLRAADEVMTAAQRARDPLTGTLRIGVIPTISPYLLPSATAGLRAAFAELKVVWSEDKTETLVRRLAEGSLDAALLALEAEIGDVEYEVVGIDPFVLATRGDDPLGRKSRPAVLAELQDSDVLLLDDGHCFREQVLSYCTRAKAREIEFRATSLSTLVHMVAGGAGVTLLPMMAVPTEAQRAGLTVRAFAEPVPARTVVLIWRKRSPMVEALRQVAQAMRSAYPAPSSPGAIAPRRQRRGGRS
jgi:LysR family hydrogen peroxide-inducible transcriptional activator